MSGRWGMSGPVSGRSPYWGSWEPEDMGFKAMTIPLESSIAALTVNSGRIEFRRIRIAKPATITGIAPAIQTGGATLTSGQNLGGLYSTAGVKLAETATQHTAWTATGWVQGAFTASYNAAAGDYFIALLSVGSTPPQWARPNNVISMNGVLTTPLSALRLIRTTSTSNTSLPSSIDFSATCEIATSGIVAALY